MPTVRLTTPYDNMSFHRVNRVNRVNRLNRRIDEELSNPPGMHILSQYLLG